MENVLLLTNNKIVNIIVADSLEGARKSFGNERIHPLVLGAEVGDSILDGKLVKNHPSNSEQKDKRRVAFAKISDPVFFKYSRGEATMEEWKKSIEMVKAMYPYYP